jgi:hypothetical protein
LNSSDEYQVQARTYEYLGLDWVDQRSVHSALIMGLKPSTKYLIKVFYNNQFWTNAIYKTLSDDPTVPLRMINAGDSGYTRPAIELTKIIATLKPDVYFIGGDVAYDDNMPACAYTWDYYLKLYGSLTSTIGYLMPIVLTVGNHDVGLFLILPTALRSQRQFLNNEDHSSYQQTSYILLSHFRKHAICFA